jgi:hypothetical protein
VAHVALADDTAFWVVLRNTVGAIPRAILAANTDFGAMQNYASERVLRIGVDGTAGQTGRFDTVIASHRQMQPLGVRVPATLDFTNSPPVDVRGIAVLLVTGDNTTLATNTFGHVEMKTVLLAG